MTAPAYTDEQRRVLAAEGRAVAVDAGAGCGKTFVLAERFVSLLAPRDAQADPATTLSRVVAITFTDAAAREMRGRIREKCRQRLARAAPDERRYWRRLLTGIDAARVSTIHSFAATLIRAHAIELGVDPAFAVLDPGEAEVLKSAAVDDVLRGLLTPREGDPPEWLLTAATELDLSGLRDAVRTLVDHADDPAFATWSGSDTERAIEAWALEYREQIAPRYAAEVRDDPATTELTELLREATPVKQGFAERVEQLADTLAALARPDDADAALKALRPLLDTKQPSGGFWYTNKDWPTADAKKRFTALLQTLRGRLDRQRRVGDAASMRRAARLGLDAHRVAAEAARRFVELKRARSVLDNDELLVEAHRLLTAPDLADALARAMGGVDALLVDEFQDTDRLQSALVTALASGEAGARLFVVGDFKQSIYRFRGAEPQVFRDLQEATPEEGRLTLSTNFRSQPAVLRFVNHVFAPLFGERYVPLRAQRDQKGPDPAVEFLWTAPPDSADGGRGPSVEVSRRAEATTIAAWISATLAANRSIAAGDIAILFRSLSNVAYYEDALRAAGIDYYLVGGQAFYAQQEVHDVANLLAAITSPSDDVALAGALRSPIFGVPDEALFWLTRSGGLNAGLAAKSLPKELGPDLVGSVTTARDTLTELRQEQCRFGAAELLALAWRRTGYDATITAEFLGERKLANLEKLHEQAREADRSGGGLPGLVDRLREFSARPPKEALAATSSIDAGVVRLMTVHAAKGLEFPVVVLADLNRKQHRTNSTAAFHPRLGPLVRPQPTAAEGDKPPPVGIDLYDAAERYADDEEQARMFYVACTRAADRLVLSSCLDPAKPPDGPWLRLLAKRLRLDNAESLDGQDERVASMAPSPPPAKAKRTTERRKLGEALAAAAAAKGPAMVPPTVPPIAIDPAELVTFSVSR